MKIKESRFKFPDKPAPSSDPYRAGWDIYNIGTAEKPILEIQRNRGLVDEDDELAFDEQPNTLFPNDSAALVYVIGRACRDGCPDARAAILTIVKSWKEGA